MVRGGITASALGAEVWEVDPSAGAGSLDALVPGDAALEVDGVETETAEVPAPVDLPAVEVAVLEVNTYTTPTLAATRTPRINKRTCQLMKASLPAIASG
jgi:hypothetical protein